ncbi:MAG: glutamate--tRNA ligase [Candidatus Bathyarchaeia archaeon]|nr:glutamate--tRNA ligase [Candidatus Bathyarchaeota archaeon]
MGIQGFDNDLRELIKKHALSNAVAHGGKADVKAVVGRVLGERVELRQRAKEVAALASEIVDYTNRLTMEEQRRLLAKWSGISESKKIEEVKALPPLPSVNKYHEVVTRFSPNPDCTLHLGSVRAAVLSHDYARMYNGRFLLRFEDTDPRLKKSALVFYDMIREDLVWLGCKWDSEYVQSDRLPIYYEYSEKLIESGGAYVCTCKPEIFKSRILSMKPCDCRVLPSNEHLLRWEKMLDGEYNEGEAVVRIKTDLTHPNPAVRDWPALRIIDTERNPHPRVGSKYRVWPLYNFSTGVDDHLMGVTHIIRGKEHLTNMRRQLFMYEHLSWPYPETIHYGRLKVEGATLSKSKIMQMVAEAKVTGFDDPRLATLAALRRRGITPETLRRIAYDVGPRPVDATLSWDNIYATNRKIVDSTASRYFFIKEPVELIIQGVAESHTAKLPLNPNDPSKGHRIFHITPVGNTVKLLISADDIEMLKRGVVRLIELFNIEAVEVRHDRALVRFHSREYLEAKRLGSPLIHWLPLEGNIRVRLVMPDASEILGLGENFLAKESSGKIVQLVRFGFGRIDKMEKDMVTIYYGHN